jgi:RNA polymerase sigma factor (sigma-70 family)
LIAKYGWTLLPADDLVELALQAARMEDPPVGLERLITHQYKIALYAACRQTADLALRKRAYSDLFRYLYRATHKRWPDMAPEMAEEIAQRAMLLTYEKLDDCRSPAGILGFALGQARRACTELVRIRQKEVSLGWLTERGAELVQPPPEPPRFDQDCLRMLLDTLGRLSERQRQMIALKYFEGLSDTVISERTGLSIANVRVLRNRGLNRLRADQRLRDTCVEA